MIELFILGMLLGRGCDDEERGTGSPFMKTVPPEPPKSKYRDEENSRRDMPTETRVED